MTDTNTIPNPNPTPTMTESKNILSTDPDVYTIDNYLTETECQHFIDLGKPRLKRALVSGSNDGYVSNGRTGQNCWIRHDTDKITKRVGEKIAKLVGIPLENAEAFQIIYYGVTQEYRQHYDGWEHNNSEKTLRNMKYGGQRLWTGLCYLNDVEEGGGTRFNRIDTEVQARKGRLCVFRNTLKDSHVRHPLSEHAGMPVIKGEKYAFNLWFREYNSKKLYRDFNPEYYRQVTSLDTNDKIRFFTKGRLLHPTKNIMVIDDFISETEMNVLETGTNFDQSRPTDRKWFKKVDIPTLVCKIESMTQIPSDLYENINMVYYQSGYTHQSHFDAYDLNSEAGKKYTIDLGQRLYTLTGFLSTGVNYEFDVLNTTYSSKRGSLLVYQNNIDNRLERDFQIRKQISNTRDEEDPTGGVILFHIYIRAKTKTDKYTHTFVKRHYTQQHLIPSIPPQTPQTSQTPQTTGSLTITPTKIIPTPPRTPENYTETLEEVLRQFSDESRKSFTSYKSLTFTNKLPYQQLSKYIDDFKTARKVNSKDYNHGSLCKGILDQSYTFDEFTPVVVQDIITEQAIEVFKRYYRDCFSKRIFPLGDRQSNRYKAHNEPMSRLLQYEIHPLIEHILGKKVRPTYTYLSAYVKDADLPAHTDRADCEYTVSFVIDKPNNTNWNIYFHKIKQPKKHNGRYDFTPDKSECIAIDCDPNGLMMFGGMDHIHFRERLQHDYYTIVLLHYCSIND